MSETDKYEHVNFRLTKLEDSLASFATKQDQMLVMLTELKTVLPTGGLQCPIHFQRMEQMEKRLDKQEAISDAVTKKIVTWSAVFSVILFLVAQLAIPFFLDNIKMGPNQHNSLQTITNTNRVVAVVK